MNTFLNDMDIFKSINLLTPEEEVIENSKLDTVYQHNLNNGKFFSVVSESYSNDSSEYTIKLSTKTQIKIFVSTRSGQPRSIEFIKLINSKEKQKLRIDDICLDQLKIFLSFLIDIDAANYDKQKTSLYSVSDNPKIFNDFQKILENEDGEELIKQILDLENITSHDIVSTGYRKAQLEIFRQLLQENYIDEYKSKVLETPNAQNEKAWQEFFNSNQWIFGYGLDYKFKSVLQKEFHASNTDVAGKGAVISDFLMGDKRYTSFVEIKLPTTTLFKKQQNRSGCWKLSSELIDAYSQILEHKASGELKLESQKETHDEAGNLIKQHAYDAKVFLIIGVLKELEESDCSDLEKKIKLKTFELFRRDSRNVEIMTYDELFERAKFIVEHKS